MTRRGQGWGVGGSGRGGGALRRSDGAKGKADESEEQKKSYHYLPL